ncbi:MAG: hypothetical protein RBS57_08485 [Desulforhabdus sp.]|nr:hypothetical protein [Desulforhabdus sp.]
MNREHLRAPGKEAGEAAEDVSSLRTDEEGMSAVTARLIIEKNLRRKIM